MKCSKELRLDAWNALKEGGQYWHCLTAYLLLTLVAMVLILPLLAIAGTGVGISGIAPYFAPGGKPEVALFLDPAVALPLSITTLILAVMLIYPIGYVKWARISIPLAAIRHGVKISHAFSGWGHGWKMGWVVMVKFMYLSLWYLLLIIPGVIKTFSYAMTEFIAVDHPDWSADQCISESRRLMAGNRLRLVFLYLSFIGWWLLVVAASMLVPFIGNGFQLLIMPYQETAIAAFYEDLLDADEADDPQDDDIIG